jgi:hypothetical protein
MKKMKLVILASILLLIGTAQAGFKLPYGANVDLAGRTAWGDSMSARSSADTHAAIGCAILGYSTGSGAVLCSAVNSAGVNAYCFSSNATIIAAAASAGPSSYYYFQWDASSQCTYLYVSNESVYGPVTP